MPVLTSIILVLFLVIPGPCFSIFGGDYLVKINGVKYTEKDFKNWWFNWKDNNTKINNSTIQEFVNWILLSDEAEYMGLDQEPSYKRKVSVFLKVRSLLQLRYDEVLKRIKMDEDKLWDLYVSSYTPLVKIKILMTDNRSEAQSWMSAIKGADDFNRLFKLLAGKGKAKDMGWRRPINIPQGIREKIVKAKKGEIVGPLRNRNTWLVALVVDKKGPSKEDFNRLKNTLAERYRKQMEDKLTQELIERLKEKYGVTVNWDLIKKIGLKELPRDLENKTVVTVGKERLKAYQFHQMLRREAELRLRGNYTDENLDRLKKYIIDSVIAQTLVDEEALSRHYEKSVLRDLYWFYKRNQLIREFDKKVVWPRVKVTEEEIKDYYKKHKDDFTIPEMVEIMVIQTKDEKLIKNIYARIKSGESFSEVAKGVMFHGAVPQKIALNRLVPPVREAVEKLPPGGISGIIKYKDWFFLVKLIKRYPRRSHSFNKVKESIRKSIAQEKFNELKKDYIEKLRKASEIHINSGKWKKLLSELGG